MPQNLQLQTRMDSTKNLDFKRYNKIQKLQALAQFDKHFSFRNLSIYDTKN